MDRPLNVQDLNQSVTHFNSPPESVHESSHMLENMMELFDIGRTTPDDHNSVNGIHAQRRNLSAHPFHSAHEAEESAATEEDEIPFLYTLVSHLLHANTEEEEGKQQHLQQVYQWYLENKEQARLYQKKMRVENRTTEETQHHITSADVYPKTAPAYLLYEKDGTQERIRGKRGGQKIYFPAPCTRRHGREDTWLKYKPKWGRSSRCMTSRPPSKQDVVSSSTRPAREDGEQIESSTGAHKNSGKTRAVEQSHKGTRAHDYSLSPETSKDVEELSQRYSVLNLKLDVLPFIDVHINRLPHRSRRTPSPFRQTPRDVNRYSPQEQHVKDIYLNGHEIIDDAETQSEGVTDANNCIRNNRTDEFNEISGNNENNKSINNANTNASNTNKNTNTNYTTYISNKKDNDRHSASIKHKSKNIRRVVSATRTSIEMDQKLNQQPKDTKALKQKHRYRRRTTPSPTKQLTEGLRGSTAPLLQRSDTHLDSPSSGDVGKSVWVTQGTVFPRNQGYINFTRSLMYASELKDNLPLDNDDLKVSTKNTNILTTNIHKKVENKKLIILNSLQKQNRKPTNSRPKVGPPINTNGKNMTLTPRPPNNANRSSLRVGSPRVGSGRCSPRSSSRNDNSRSPSRNDNDITTNTYADASKLLSAQNKAALNIQKLFRGHVARKHMKQLRESDIERRKRVRSAQNKSAKARRSQVAALGKVAASSTIHKIFHNPSLAEKNRAAVEIQRVFKGWYVRRLFAKCKSKVEMRALSLRGFIHDTYVPHLKGIMQRHGVESPKVILNYNELLQYVSDRNKYESQFINSVKEARKSQAVNSDLKEDSFKKSVTFASDQIREKMDQKGDSLAFQDIKGYLASCGLFPSKQEIVQALTKVTQCVPKREMEMIATHAGYGGEPSDEATEEQSHEQTDNESDRPSDISVDSGSEKLLLNIEECRYKKREVVEMTFEIYHPKGAGLGNVRQSTWMNPLVGDPLEEAVKLLGKSKKIVKDTDLEKCLDLVAESKRERTE